MAVVKQKAVFLSVMALWSLAGNAHAQIIALNQNFGVSLPVSLGGADIQPGTSVSISVADIQVDPNTSTVSTVTRERNEVISTDQPLTVEFDAATDLSGSGFEGVVTGQAGGDEARTQMDVSSIDVDPGDGVTLSSSSLEYQTLRFESPTDTQIQVDVTYLLTGSVTAVTGSLPVSASAVSVLQIFDLGSFVPSFEEDGFQWGTADVAIYDLLVVDDGDGSVDSTATFSAMTNRDYVVFLGAIASVQVADLIESAAVDISITASADPVFSVNDPDVSIVRTIITETHQVPEPATFALLGLGFLVLCFARIRNGRTA